MATRLYAFALVMPVVVCCWTPQAARAQVTDATIGAALESAKAKILDTVEQAVEDGANEIVEAALRLLDVVESMMAAFFDRLDETLARADQSVRNAVSQVEAAANSVVSRAEGMVADVQSTVLATTSTLEGSVVGDRARYIVAFSPTVIVPGAQDPDEQFYRFRIRGIRMDESDMTVELPNGETVRPSWTGPTVGTLAVPRSAIPGDSRMRVYELPVRHMSARRRGLFRTRTFPVTRSITIAVMGDIALTVDVQMDYEGRREERRVHTQDVGRLSGRNRERRRSAAPPHGWKWDLRGGPGARREFSARSTGRGEAGRCTGLSWNGATERGISVVARLDEIREVGLFRVRHANGYANCGVRGPIYRIVREGRSFHVEDQVRWGRDMRITLPSDTADVRISIVDYRGVTHEVNGSESTSTFQTTRHGNDLIIRAVPPQSVFGSGGR